MREEQVTEMTDREQLQAEVAEWLSTWCDVLPTTPLQPVARGGYVRPVTFADPFRFTGTLLIWSVDRMVLRLTGMENEIIFETLDEFKTFCQRRLDAPRREFVNDLVVLRRENDMLRKEVAALRDQNSRLSAQANTMRAAIRDAAKATSWGL